MNKKSRGTMLLVISVAMFIITFAIPSRNDFSDGGPVREIRQIIFIGGFVALIAGGIFIAMSMNEKKNK